MLFRFVQTSFLSPLEIHRNVFIDYEVHNSGSAGNAVSGNTTTDSKKALAKERFVFGSIIIYLIFIQ